MKAALRACCGRTRPGRKATGAIPTSHRKDVRRPSNGCERLEPLVPEGMDLSELALRFILENAAVTTTIPGMRRPAHVDRNLAVSDGVRLPPRLRDALRAHRWNRP